MPSLVRPGIIVGVMDQQDQIIAHIFIRLNDAVVELLKQCIVLQTAVSKTQQKFLRAALLFRSLTEFQIQQILADGAGQTLPQNLEST